MEPEVFEKWMMIVLVGGLMAFMAFIIWDLAKKSKAGRLGTAILFLGLGLCLFAFLAKPIIGAHHNFEPAPRVAGTGDVLQRDGFLAEVDQHAEVLQAV